jgi:tetratricopeptide (TPR) repeat protein
LADKNLGMIRRCFITVAFLSLVLALGIADAAKDQLPTHNTASQVQVLPCFQSKNNLHKSLEYWRAAKNRYPADVMIRLLHARCAEKLGEFDEALDSMQFVTRFWPTAGRLFELGRLAEKMGKLELAEEALSAVHRDEAIERRFRGRLAELLFRVLLQSGKRDGAIALASKEGWIRADENYCEEPTGISAETSQLVGMLVARLGTDCLLQLGFSLTEGGAVNLARMVLLDRIQNSQNVDVRKRAQWFLEHRLPDHTIASQAETLNGLGYTFQHASEEPGEALQLYSRAIAIDPTFSWPYNNIGIVYRDREDHDQASRWFQLAIAVNPHHWKAHRNLGSLLTKLDRYEDALPHLEQALRLNPEDVDNLNDLGYCFNRLERIQESFDTFKLAVPLSEAALRRDPDDAHTLNSLSYSLYHLGRYEDALRGLRITAEHYPSDVGAQFRLGWALVSTGRNAEAVFPLERAIDLDPNDVRSHHALGYALFRLDRMREALVPFREAVRLAPNDVHHVANLGRVLVKAGEMKEGRDVLEQLLKMDPTRTDDREFLRQWVR